MFLFEALNELYENYPVGYEGKTKIADYFRFIVPTIYATIKDIPEELRKYIVVSDSRKEFHVMTDLDFVTIPSLWGLILFPLLCIKL